MATLTDSKLANRILKGFGLGLLAGVLTLWFGDKVPVPSALHGVLSALGLGRPENALGLARGLADAVLDPIGRVFLRLLFFVVIPLVFASLASGVLQLGRPARLGPLAGRTFGLFALNMAIAVGLGLVMMNVLHPGALLDAGVKEQLLAEYGGVADRTVQLSQSREGLSLKLIVEMFMPANLLAAVVGSSPTRLGDVLPLILFALLVGVAGMGLADEPRRRLHEGLDLVAQLMTSIVHFALRLAPYAVPCLIYSVLVKSGLDILRALAVFVAGCALAMSLHLFGTMTLWLRLWTGRSPRAYFSAIKSVLVTAFSTSSSSATLPTSIEAARERLGVSPGTAGFVLPLGATMNMAGTALYEGCVVLFVAQVFGVELTLAQQATLVSLAVLSAVAVAGIPGGSLPLIAGLLATFGVPPEGIGIILGTDRLLDMCRTTLNVAGDLTTAVVVDEMEKRAEARRSKPAPASAA